MGADVLGRERAVVRPVSCPPPLPRRVYAVLYDHRSAGEGWLETREEMGAAGELQLCRSPSAQQCEQAWWRGFGRQVEVTPTKRDEAKFPPFSC